MDVSNVVRVDTSAGSVQAGDDVKEANGFSSFTFSQFKKKNDSMIFKLNSMTFE